MASSNVYENPTVPKSSPPPPPGSPPPPPSSSSSSSNGGTKAAAIALGGTAALAGAAFLASQYWGEDTHSGSGGGGGEIGVVKPGQSVHPTPHPEPEKPEDHRTDEDNSQTDGHEPTFADAFKAARAQHAAENHGVGGGGSFVWHGDTYNTYLVEEWDHMNTEQKDEYLVSVYGDSYHGHHHHNSHPDPLHDVPQSESVLAHHSSSTDVPQADSSVPESTPVEHTTTPASVTDSSTDQHNITILDNGTIETSKGNVDYVLTQVDGHDVVYLDVNQDGKMETALVDSDGDHVLETYAKIDPTTHQVTHTEQLEHPLDLSNNATSEPHLAVNTHTEHEVYVLDSGTIDTNNGTADYVLTSVDGHHVVYYDTNHDGHADEVIVDMDNDNIADAHGSFDPTTHELGNLEEIHHTDPSEGMMADDMSQDFNNDADISDWVS